MNVVFSGEVLLSDSGAYLFSPRLGKLVLFPGHILALFCFFLLQSTQLS